MSANPLSSDRLNFDHANASISGDAGLANAEPAYGRIRMASVMPAASVESISPTLENARLGSGEKFFRELQREKRRADRSKTPLSIALYRIDSCEDGPFSIEELDELLHEIKRQTDISSRVGNDAVAVILPDTNVQGARRFLEKLRPSLETLGVSAIAAGYPSQDFEALVSAMSPGKVPSEKTLGDQASDVQVGYPLKRPLDIVGASIALVLLSPLMLLTAAAIAVSSPGPVIYKQKRLGRAGVQFTFYKFRSMVANIDDGVHRKFVAELIKGEIQPPAEGKTPVFKIKSDPRVTWVGKRIRRLSIDEIPQFFNVLKGEMSLVGPRPALPYEAENYQAWHLRRVQNVKPGITGIWQVEGRSKVSFDDMVRMDLRYVRQCSLLLDLKILFRTVWVVIGGEGAT